MLNYIVYSARFPNGSLYIGRTGQSLSSRIESHYASAEARKDNRRISVALRSYSKESVEWSILFETSNVFQSKGKEIAEILKARKSGERLLNLTRGGFYDPYDAGIKKAKGGWTGRY